MGSALAMLILYVGAGTQNRGGLVAGFLVIAGVPLVSRQFGAALAILSLVVVVVLGISYATGASVSLGAERDLSVRQLVDNIVSVGAVEDTGRFGFWSPVVDDVLTQEHFLTGLGFGENLGDRYGWVFSEDSEFGDLTAAEANVNPLRNVHSSQLNVLARMGVVGLVLWVLAWGFWYVHLFRARARLRMVDSPRRAAYLGWAMLAAFAILINSFFDGTVEGPQVGVWLWAIVGLGSAIAMETNLREWQRRRAGTGDIAREGGETNPLEMSLWKMKRASRRARR
jgi:O-antigen ligase